MDAEALDGCVLQLDEAMAGSAERAGEMGSLEIAADAAEGAGARREENGPGSWRQQSCICAATIGDNRQRCTPCYHLHMHTCTHARTHEHAPKSTCPPHTRADLELVRRYTLRQEGAAAKDELFVAAPTEHSAGALEVLRPARRLVVAEDVAAANEALVARAHGGTPELQFYPHAMPAERANRLLQKEVCPFWGGGEGAEWLGCSGEWGRGPGAPALLRKRAGAGSAIGRCERRALGQPHVSCWWAACCMASVACGGGLGPWHSLILKPFSLHPDGTPQHIFKPPPAEPPKGTWPPPGWQPDAALQERDKRRAARRRKGLPEVDPRDDLEQQPLTDLRPAPGAPWGEAGGRPLPPQWQALPGGGGGGGALLGDVEQDVSVSYRYA